MPGTATLMPFDYGVTAVILAAPVVISVVSAVRNASKMSRLEYLLGSRQMSLMPVTMSLFVTFQSAISLIGIPTEVYSYSTAVLYFSAGLVLCNIVLYFIFVPLMYPLEVTSIYEYLLLRFESPAVRMLSVVIGCLQSICMMAVTLLTPALVLQAAGDLPMWMSVLIVGGVGTIYTVIGGIRSVIWTDVFQTVIVFVGLLAIVIKGSIAVGGLDQAWNIASEGGRINFFKVNPDPRIRLNVWGATFGSMIMWMGSAFNQATLQRIRSLKNLRTAKMLYLTSIPFHVCYGVCLNLVGIVTYAYFQHSRCDPLEAGLVSNSNQLVPFFVLHALNDIPGLPGLYMATLFCAALSTLSSGINALAANTVEDFLERPLRRASERQATACTKMAAALHGLLICCLAYAAQFLRGSVIQLGLSVLSAFGTPTLGMFLLAGAVPWANKYGALAGGVVSLTFNLWVGIGSRFAGRKHPPLPPADVDQCSNFSSNYVINVFPDAADSQSLFNDEGYYYNISSSGTGSTRSSSSSGSGGGGSMNGTLQQETIAAKTNAYGFFLYDMSYEWLALYGIIVSLAVGLLVSYVTRDRKWRENCHVRSLVFPFVKPLWGLEAGKQETFVNFSENPEMARDQDASNSPLKSISDRSV